MPRSLSDVALAPATAISLLKEIHLCEGEIYSVSFFPLLCIFLSKSTFSCQHVDHHCCWGLHSFLQSASYM